jgi:hypothetical protein
MLRAAGRFPRILIVPEVKFELGIVLGPPSQAGAPTAKVFHPLCKLLLPGLYRLNEGSFTRAKRWFLGWGSRLRCGRLSRRKFWFYGQ